MLFALQTKVSLPDASDRSRRSVGSVFSRDNRASVFPIALINWFEKDWGVSMRERIGKTRLSMVFLFFILNRLFLIPTVLSRKILLTAPKKAGIIVLGLLAKVSLPFDLHFGITWFASLAQVIGGKEVRFMKAKIKYTDGPMGDLKIVKDFLPPPDQLVLREDNEGYYIFEKI
jgi:hypothetical protein